MSNMLRQATAILTVIAVLFLATAALAQMPTSPWKKAAPFPEPDEELYGVAVDGKLYVIGGFGSGKAPGATYEYDPGTDKWAKKKSMPRPAHHAALAAANGKIYVVGGFVAPEKTTIPVGAAWEPIEDVWEYDPAADSWKSLAPLPTKRGSAVAVEVAGKIYVIGGYISGHGPVDTVYEYDQSANRWRARSPMPTARGALAVAEQQPLAARALENDRDLDEPAGVAAATGSPDAGRVERHVDLRQEQRRPCRQRRGRTE